MRLLMPKFAPILAASLLLIILPAWSLEERELPRSIPILDSNVVEFPRAQPVADHRTKTITKQPVKMIAAPVAHAAAEPAHPSHLFIPSIKLESPIVSVGVNTKGEMDVPSGRTNNVGWYKNGTLPGKEGSAVLDAHVYAAFSNLHKLKVGDDVYVEDERGTKLHFRVTAMQTYALKEVPLQKLFNRSGDSYLNLITCAGTFMPAQGTYSHRLIVYTTLVD